MRRTFQRLLSAVLLASTLSFGAMASIQVIPMPGSAFFFDPNPGNGGGGGGGG